MSSNLHVTFLNIPLNRFSFTPNDVFSAFFPDDQPPSDQDRKAVFNRIGELAAGFIKETGTIEAPEIETLLGILIDYLALHHLDEDPAPALLLLATGLLLHVHEQAIEDQLPTLVDS